MIPLFEHFPALKNKPGYIRLCDLPTPILHIPQYHGSIRDLFTHQSPISPKNNRRYKD